jgi:ElaB/YqjD/DUF883 family membrane-anchored ribosome-binding protein
MSTQSQSGKDLSDHGHFSGRKDSDLPHSGELKDSLVEVGSKLRTAAAHAVPAAREQISRAGDSVAAHAESLEESLTVRIRENPLGSMLVAAGVGVFAGLFLMRR